MDSPDVKGPVLDKFHRDLNFVNKCLGTFPTIERFIGKKVPRVKLDNFDYQYTALFEEEKQGQKPSFPGKVRGARVRGGYFFGPARRR